MKSSYISSLLFIDANVGNYQNLVKQVNSNTEVIIIDSQQDGIKQITQTIAARKEIKTVEIISHGGEGAVQLGNTVFSQDNLQEYSEQIQQWGQSLTPDADILFYGCNVAGGKIGAEFVRHLSNLTGADIAASKDLTGNSSLGGDWQLEIATGDIEAKSALTAQIRDNYEGVLKIIKVSNTNDSGTGSLRQAIIDANNNSGLDVIDLKGVSGSINLNSSLPTLSTGNDLFVMGNSNIVIDGQDKYQIISVDGANVGFEGVEFEDGYVTGGDAGGGGGGGLGAGGAIFINKGNVFINNVTFDSNRAEGGDADGNAGKGGDDEKDGSQGGYGGRFNDNSAFAFNGAAPGSAGISEGGDGGKGSDGVFGAGGGAGGGGAGGDDFGHGGKGGAGGFGAGGGGGGGGGHDDDVGSDDDGSGGVGGQGGSFGGSGASGVGGGGSRDGGRGGGGAGLGGAIFVNQEASLTISNGSFTNNSVIIGSGGNSGQTLGNAIARRYNESLVGSFGDGNINNVGIPANSFLNNFDNLPTIKISPVTAGEQNKKATFKLEVTSGSLPSGSLPSGVDVFYYLSNTNGATEGSDFTPDNSFKVRLTSNNQTFDVPVVDDNEYETGLEQFTLQLLPGQYKIDSQNQATVSITDNETKIGIEKVSDLIEGGKAGTIKLISDRIPVDGQTITLNFQATNGSASSQDYTLLPVTINKGDWTLENGKYTKTVDIVNAIETNDDKIYDPNETLSIKLNGGTGYVIDSNKQQVAYTIQDNEPLISIEEAKAAIEGKQHGQYKIVFDKQPPQKFNLYLNLPAINQSVSGQATRGTIADTKEGSDYKLYYRYNANDPNEKAGFINNNGELIAIDPSKLTEKDASGKYFLTVFAEVVNDNLYEDNAKENLTISLRDNVVNTEDGYAVDLSKQTLTTQIQDNEPKVSLGNVFHPSEGFGDGSTLVNLKSALKLTGKNYISVPENKSLDLSQTGQFTQEAWILPTATTDGYQGILGYQPTADNNKRSPGIWLYNKTGIQAGFGDGTNWNSFTVEKVLNPNQWNHVATTFDGNEYRLYVNGNLVSNNTDFKGKIPYSNQQLSIGKIDNNFQGQIDEVRQWNVARTYQDIQDNLLETLKGDEAGLVGYWQFNQNTNDSSINQNHGILQGSTGQDYLENPLPQIGYVEVNLDKPVDNAIGLWVRYNLSGNAIQGTDYYASQVRRSTGEQPFNSIIIPNKEQAGKIYFTALPDAIKEGDEQIKIELTPYNFDGVNTDGSYGVIGNTDNSNYVIDSNNKTANIIIKDNSAYQPGIVIKDQFDRVVNNSNPLTKKQVIAIDDLFSGKITVADSTSPYGKEKENAFDRQLNTSWLTSGKTGWLQYQFKDNQKYIVNQYNITSASDKPETDPKNWNFQGSNDGFNWANLDTRSNETFASRGLSKIYNFNNSQAYQFYRLNITDNNGGNELQLAEWQLKNSQLDFSDLPGNARSSNFFSDDSYEAFDNQPFTKWDSYNNTAWLQYQFNDGKAYVINQYTLTSAVDKPEADPKEWQLQGSNDGSNWNNLDTRKDETFTSRGQTKTYDFNNSQAYQFYRLNITQNNGASGFFSFTKLHLAEVKFKNKDLQLTDLPGTITANNVLRSSPVGEEKEKAFDNQSTTKWLTFHDKGWLQYQFNDGQPRIVNQYTLTSANDESGKDPQDWKLLGSNDGKIFVEIDNRTGETFASRFLTKTYDFDNKTAYQYYRLEVTKNAGAKELQLAELQFNAINSSEAIFTFELQLSSQPTAPVTVNLTSPQGALSKKTLTIQPADWDKPQNIALSGATADAKVTATFTSTDAAYNNITKEIPFSTTIQPTILQVTEGNLHDKEIIPLVRISAIDTGIDESIGQNGEFLITLSDPAPEQGLKVFYTIGGSASRGEDYQLLNDRIGEVEILPGEKSAILALNVIDDFYDETTENITINLREKIGSYILNKTNTSANASAISIEDNDTSAIEIVNVNKIINDRGETEEIRSTSLSAIDTSENLDSANFSVRLNTKPISTVTIKFEGIDATESKFSTETLTFTPDDWDRYQQVTVTGVNDQETDGDVAYQVKVTTVSNDSDYSGNAQNVVEIINRDNESAFVSLEQLNNTSLSDEERQKIIKEQTQKQEIQAETEIKNELGKDINLDFTQTVNTTLPQASISSTSSQFSENGAPLQLTVKLNKASTQDLVIKYGVVGGNAEAGIDYTVNSGSFVLLRQLDDANPLQKLKAGNNSSAAFADVDRDGLVDVVAIGKEGTVKYYQNQGNEFSDFFVEQTGDKNPFANLKIPDGVVSSSDLNNDQRPDFIFGTTDGSVKYYQSNSDGLIQPSQLTLNSQNTETAKPIQVPGKALASNFNSPRGEESDKAFDANSNTKWLIFAKEGWIQYQFNDKQAFAVNQYTITSANDEPTRDPKNWVLQGSVDGQNWTNLDTRSNETFTSRLQTRSFSFSNIKPYEYYRLNVTSNNGNSAALQLADLQLFAPNLNVNKNSAPVLTDLNSDRLADLIITSLDGSVKYYKNTGTPEQPVFTEQTGTANSLSNLTGNLAFADLDKDGDLDVTSGSADGKLKYYQNQNGIFNEQTGVNSPYDGELFDIGDNAKPVFTDLDGDKNPDLVVGGADGTFDSFINTSGIKIAKGQTSGTINLKPIDDRIDEDPENIDEDPENIEVQLFTGQGYQLQPETFVSETSQTVTAQASILQKSQLLGTATSSAFELIEEAVNVQTSGDSEEATNLIDLDRTTNWSTTGKSGSIAYQFNNDKALVVNQYSITAGDDVTQAPKDWIFQGSNDGEDWTNLDSKTFTFARTGQTQAFQFNNSTAYKQYRLNITNNNGGSELKLASLDLFKVSSATSPVGQEAIKAFDDDTTTSWSIPSRSGSIAFANQQSLVVQQYRITAGDDITQAPQEWIFQGSNDGQDWSDLDLRTFVFTTAKQTQAFQFNNSTAYKQYRLNIANNNGGSELKLASLDLFTVDSVTSPIGQEASQAFDNNDLTNWSITGRSGILQSQFDRAEVISKYSITSANNSPTTAPRDWILQGSTDGQNWVDLHTHSGESFTDFTTKTFSLNNTTAYKQYRLNVSNNNGGSSLQVAELNLLYEQANSEKIKTTVELVDDDDKAGVTIKALQTATETTEATSDRYLRYQVNLNSQPTKEVTVYVGTSKPEDAQVSLQAPSATGTVTNLADFVALTFTPENWNQPQTVTVKGIDDLIDDGDSSDKIPYTLVTSLESEDLKYHKLEVKPDINLTNLDNDTAGLKVNLRDDAGNLQEGTTNVFTVTLNTQPIDEVTVTVSPGDDQIVLNGEQPRQDITLTFDEKNWNQEQIVRLVAVDDGLVEYDHQSQIAFTVDSYEDKVYDRLTPKPETVKVRDNDLPTAKVVPGWKASELEGAPSGFMFYLNHPAPKKEGDAGIKVNYEIIGGSATYSTDVTRADYQPIAKTGSVVIAPGDIQNNLLIVPIDDKLVETTKLKVTDKAVTKSYATLDLITTVAPNATPSTKIDRGTQLTFNGVKANVIQDAELNTIRQAIKFDGVDDSVILGKKSDFDNLTNTITVESWIKVDKFDKTWQTILAKGGSSWQLSRNENGNTLHFALGNGSRAVNGNTNVNDGQLHHVAAVYDGKALSLYVDGKLDNTVQATGSIPTNDKNVLIGANEEFATRNFNGLIDEVRIWNTARTAQEIQDKFNNQLQGDETGLLAYYRGDETLGNELTDLSGNNQNGILTGAKVVDVQQGRVGVAIDGDANLTKGSTATFGTDNSTLNLTDFTVDQKELTLKLKTDRASQLPILPISHGTELNFGNGVVVELTEDVKLAGVGNSSSLKFDGDNDLVILGTESDFDNLTNTITVESWIKVDKFDKTWQTILAKGDSSWRLSRNENGNTLHFALGDGTRAVNGNTNVNDGQWHHVSGVYDGKALSLYVDGKLDNTVQTTGSIPTNNFNVLIGANEQTTGRNFSGQIDEVRIWNTARTEAEIKNNYDRTLTGTENGLLSYYQANEGSGTTLKDLAGTLQNGTLQNGTTWQSDNLIYTAHEGIVKVLIDADKADKINTTTSQAKLAEETVQIKLLPGEGYQLGEEKTEASLGIVDDDEPGVRIIEFGDHTTVIEGETATFQLSLLSEPTSNVTISFYDPNGQVRVSNPQLVFTPENWYKLQTVTVSGIDEAVIEEGDFHSTFLKYDVTSTDQEYNKFAVADQQVDIIDRLIDKEQAIAGVTEGLRSTTEILGNLELPLLGSGEGKVPGITEGLDKEVADAIEETDLLTTDKLENILEEALHNYEISLDSFGIDETIKPFAGVDVVVNMTPDDLNVKFEAGDSYKLFDVGLDADLGIPALGLETKGSISSYFYYDLGLGFGFHKDFGFYIDTENTKFDAGFKLILGEGKYDTDKNGVYSFQPNSSKDLAAPKPITNTEQSKGEFSFIEDEAKNKVYWDKNNNGKAEDNEELKSKEDKAILDFDLNNNGKLDSNLEATANVWFLKLDVANDPNNPSGLGIDFNASLLDDLTEKFNFLDTDGDGKFTYNDANSNGKFDKGEAGEPTGTIRNTTKVDANNQKTTVQELVFNAQDPNHTNPQFKKDPNQVIIEKDAQGKQKFAATAGNVITTQEDLVEVFLDLNGNKQRDSNEPIGKGDRIEVDRTNPQNPEYKLKFDPTNSLHTAADKNKNNQFDTKPDPIGQGKYLKEGLIRYFDFNLNNQLDYFEPSTTNSTLLNPQTKFQLVKNSPDSNNNYYYFDSNNDNNPANDRYRLIQQTTPAATTGGTPSTTWYFDLNDDSKAQNYEKLEPEIVNKIYDSTAGGLKNGGVLTAYTNDPEGTFVKVDDGNRLTVGEIKQLFTNSKVKFKDLIQYNLGGEANLGLETKTSIEGDTALPSFGANLAVNYPIFNLGNQTEAGQTGFTLAFNDMNLDLGGFITDFAKPIFDSLNDLFQPLRPVIDFLNTDTGFLIKVLPEYDTKDLVKGFSGNGDGKLSLIEFFSGAANDPDLRGLLEPLLKEVNLTPEQFKNSIATAKKLIDIFTAVDKVVKQIAAFKTGENITIDLGDYAFDDVKGASTDPADSTSNAAADTSVNDPNIAATPATQTTQQQAAQNPQAKSLLDSLTSIPGLDFEFLNPITVLRILLGEKDVDLVKFDVPDLNLIFPFTTGEQVLGYVPPGLEVTGRFDANASLKTDLFVGFDTRGLELWSDDDFSVGDSYKVFDGFYLRDGIDTNEDSILQPNEDSDELTLGALAKLSLSANAYIAKLTGYGGLEGTAGLDIVDGGERNGTSDGKVRFSELGEKLSKVFSGELGGNVGSILTEFIDLTGKLEAFFGIEVKVGISIFGKEIMKTVYKDELGRQEIFKFNLADLFPNTISPAQTKTSNTIAATIGNDNLAGTNANDTINGHEGNDTLKGEQGNDGLMGDKGEDSLLGGTGNDTLDGNDGKDTLLGETGEDRLKSGNDDDSLDGGADKDLLEGGLGNDSLDGGSGTDNINGEDGNDSLLGNAGNDTLIGGTGDDTLIGGTGDDVLNGGAGKDTFRFVFLKDNGFDRIIDFQKGDDRINLSKATFSSADKLTYQDGILSYDDTQLAVIEYNNSDVVSFSTTNDVTFF